MTLATSTTLGSIVADHPAAARIFEQFGLDYCCGGRRSLADACAAKGLDPQPVIVAIQAAANQPRDDRDWSAAPLAELADHIEQTHHAYLKRELPRLSAISRKVAAVHGQAHPEYAELAREYETFAADMIAHMGKEERMLFPWIRRLEPGHAEASGISAPIDVMEHEHDAAGRLLERMAELTNNFTPPADCCATTRTLIDSLRQLNADTHVHVHKENNILFPRALQMPTAAPCTPPGACHAHPDQRPARPRL